VTTIPLILKDVVKTWELHSVGPEETVYVAMQKMLDKNLFTLLVPRKDKHDAYGIVTKKDILSKVIAEGKDPKKVKVKAVMTKPLVILTNLTLDLRWVAKAMANSGVSTIAVFDKGDFYGYVTEACILEGVYNALRRAKLEQGAEFVSC
jgi:signal-transduction protein with cAMP-binding, CBS, and nucleotidyltransferase domain